MKYKNVDQQDLIRFKLEGSRQLNNIFWALAVTAGGLGFFLSGISSFFKKNLLLLSNPTNLSFIPQGIVLVFYGTVGLSLGIFLWLTIFWDVGSGYNEYNKEDQKVILYRRSFPGKNREIYFKFNFNELKSIKMFITEGLNPKRQLFLCLNDNREIPLSGNNKPLALNQIETDAVKLAKYLNIYLETN